MPNERVTVLLGAGASWDANVPVSTDLTQAITHRLERRPGGQLHTDTSQALNLAIGALIAYEASRGAGAYDGIDVEKLFSAVQMLGHRDDLEISPFVSSWSSGLDEITTPRHSLSGFFGRDFAEAIAKGNGHKIQRLFAESVRALTKSGESQEVYRRLESEMVGALIECLEFEEDCVDYLAPLFGLDDSRPMQIATLNYDTTVETAARRSGIDLDTGIDRWSGGMQWAWRTEADARLLKLHGSVDWIEAPQGKDEWIPFRQRRYVSRSALERTWYNPDQLGVVFGQRGKLRANGPFLAMLVEFEDFLRNTDRLVVVGYSFRDDHINEVIGQWIASSSDPRLTLIDPALRDLYSRRYGVSGFLGNLAWMLYDETPSREPRLKDGHVVLTSGARTALARLAGAPEGGTAARTGVSPT